MRYKATMTLNTKGGLIHPGDIVPNGYGRLEEAIKRGWVEAVADIPLPPTPLAPQPEKPDAHTPKEKPVDLAPPAPPLELPLEEEESTDKKPEGEEEKLLTSDSPVLDLEFISAAQGEALESDLGIKHIKDLSLFNEGDLVDVKGVGESTAAKLLAAYQSTKA